MINTTVDNIVSGNCYVKKFVVAKYSPVIKPYVYEKGSKLHDRLFYIVEGCFYITEKGGERIKATKGSFIFLPADIDYVSSWEKIEPSLYISLGFSMYNNIGEEMRLYNNITLITNKKNDEFENLLESIYDVYIMNQKFAFLNILSYFYKILFKICKIEERKNLKDIDECSDIYKAVIYLEDNYMSKISTDELAKICQMSVANFRRLFKKYKGISPMKYKTILCMKHAKGMLESGFYTVSEVSELLGCVDVSHFNKLYKSYYDKNPSEHKNKND